MALETRCYKCKIGNVAEIQFIISAVRQQVYIAIFCDTHQFPPIGILRSILAAIFASMSFTLNYCQLQLRGRFRLETSLRI